MSQTKNTGTNEIRILRGKVDSLSIYEITDGELDTLQKGSPNSTYLNIAIFLLSVGFAFLIALLTLKTPSDYVFITFTIFTVTGIVGGGILLILWYRERGNVSDVVKKIQERIPSAEIVKEEDLPAG